MAQAAESNRQRILISKETAWAEVPAAPTMKELRVRGPINFSPEKQQVKSELLRSDRNVSARVETGQAASIGFGWELVWGAEMDLLFEAAFHNTFTTIDQSALTVSVDGTANTFTRGAGSFVTDGVLVGHLVRWKGFSNAGNNNVWRVTAISPTVMTVADPANALVTEAGTGNEEYHVKSLRNGITKTSLLVEDGFLDLSPTVFYSGRGQRIGSMGFRMQAGEIVNGAVQFNGERLVPAAVTVSGGITAHSGTTPVNATANVGRLLKNGVPMTSIIRELAFNLNNNPRTLRGVGLKYGAAINLGDADVSGTMSMYLAEIGDLNDIVNHASIAYDVQWSDENGHATGLYIPAVRLSGPTESAGINSDVLQNLRFEAEAGANPYTIQIDRLAA